MKNPNAPRNASDQSASDNGRLTELEGFRGICAWWVVLAHTLSLTGNSKEGWLLSFLMDGESAVCIFVILSGFVITFLIERKRPSIKEFFARRFLRLYPLFLVCFLAAMAMQAIEKENWESELLAHKPELVSFYLERISTWEDERLAYAASSLSFCHSFIPKKILPHADRAFLPPGWSIGLEWQFYIVAPTLLFVLRSRRLVWITLLGILMLGALYVGPRWTRINNSLLFLYLPYFAVGIASYFFWDASLKGLRTNKATFCS